MVPTDLNIGFQGLALIQGQIYNPVILYQQIWIQHDDIDTCVKGSPFVNIVKSAAFLCWWTW